MPSLSSCWLSIALITSTSHITATITSSSWIPSRSFSCLPGALGAIGRLVGLVTLMDTILAGPGARAAGFLWCCSVSLDGSDARRLGREGGGGRLWGEG